MLLPSIRMVENLRFLDSQPVALPRSRYSYPVRGFELPDCLPTVGVVGLLVWFRLSPWQTPSQLPVFHARYLLRHDLLNIIGFIQRLKSWVFSLILCKREC